MATLEELQTSVLDVLDDDYFSSDRVAALINQGVRFCAGIVLLPELETSGTVSTVVGASEVEIPVAWSFDRNLYQCSSEAEIEIRVLDSLGALFREYPDYVTERLSGPVKRVCIRTSYLTYYPIPTEITELTCSFYKIPDDLVNDADVPSCLPRDFHEELLINYTLWKCFSELEDGMKGAKINTKYYQDLFNSALASLDMLIDHGQSRCRPVIDSGWI